jgi:hypothetical protein
VVATSYLLGVSTRRMEKLVETLGITRLSKSQVSQMAEDLDVQVEALRNCKRRRGSEQAELDRPRGAEHIRSSILGC